MMQVGSGNLPLFGFGKPDVEKMKSKGDIEGLLKALSYEYNPVVRMSVATALGQIGDIRAVDKLIVALKDANEAVRGKVVEALCEIGDDKALDALSSAGVVNELLIALRNSKSEIASNAAVVLGKMNPAHFVGIEDALIVALEDPSSLVRTKVAIALADMNPAYSAKAVNSLLVSLKDSESSVRANAARALGRIGEDNSVDSCAIADRLSIALKDSDSNVRSSAKFALDKIVNREEATKSLAASNAAYNEKCARETSENTTKYQKLQGELLICSKCGTTLEFMGEFGGVFSSSASVRGYGSSSDFDMWRANVCTKCRLVFCGNCIKLGYPTPCPECGHPTEPAYRGTINAMGKIRRL